MLEASDCEAGQAAVDLDQLKMESFSAPLRKGKDFDEASHHPSQDNSEEQIQELMQGQSDLNDSTDGKFSNSCQQQHESNTMLHPSSNTDNNDDDPKICNPVKGDNVNEEENIGILESGDGSNVNVQPLESKDIASVTCVQRSDGIVLSNSDSAIESVIDIQSESLGNSDVTNEEDDGQVTESRGIDDITDGEKSHSIIENNKREKIVNCSNNKDGVSPYKNTKFHGALSEPSLDTISEGEGRTEKCLELVVPGLVSPAPIQDVENGHSSGILDPNKVVTTPEHGSLDRHNGPEQDLDQNRITPERMDEQIRLQNDLAGDNGREGGSCATIRNGDQNGAKSRLEFSDECKNVSNEGRKDKNGILEARRVGGASATLIVTPSCGTPRERNGIKMGTRLSALKRSKSQSSIREPINSKCYDQFSKEHTITSSTSKLNGMNIRLRHSRESVSRFEKPFTALELSRALPRKSFFNCHDKSMKDAGFATDDPKAKQKAERLKARLERISLEFNPLPSKPQINEIANGGENIQSMATENAPEPEKQDAKTDRENENSEQEELPHFDQVDAIERNVEVRRDHNLHTHGKKRRPGSAKPEYVECKPLSMYLEYVKDNKHEYQQYLRNSRPHRIDEPVTRLVKLGQIFQFRHRGGAMKALPDDQELVMAAKALRPRTADPGKFCKARDNKSTNLWAHDPSVALRQTTRPVSDDKRQEKPSSAGGGGSSSGTQGGNAGKEEEHHKTELEKRKSKAEDWSRSVSTSTLTKAKVQSLKELGSDDKEVSKWWEAFSHCRYLRQSLPELDTW